MRSPRCADLAAVLVAALATIAPMRAFADDAPAPAAVATVESAAPADASVAIATYYAELERMGLIQVETGDRDSLTRELGAAERLLQGGAAMDAAFALFAIVASPRYAGFETFVEFQNAEYELGVALAQAGAFTSALDVLGGALARGVDAPYMAAAHQRMVDIALETRDHAGVLTRLERAAPSTGDAAGTLPASLVGERAYLRGRIAYDGGDLPAAEAQLASVPGRSRLFSSATYLRGVIAARGGKYKAAAAAMCTAAGGPSGGSGGGDAARLSFVVDDRYYTIKDLARLGLGRLAHEQGEYDDAYYHYFQIPDDSDRLPEALFEAAWSMYQQRDLPAARDLVREFLAEFPASPLWPEASLLAGYVELADCKFDASQSWYDALATRLEPIVATLDEARRDPALRAAMFDQALVAFRRKAATTTPGTSTDPLAQATALLQVEPAFQRLRDAMTGLDRAADDAASTVRDWRALARQIATTDVSKVAAETTVEQDDAAGATSLARDFAALSGAVERAERELARGRAAGTIGAKEAGAEATRLADLRARVATARRTAERAARDASRAVPASAPAELRPMIQRDIDDAQRLTDAAAALRERLAAGADGLAQRAIERVYADTKRVLDKARLGKIDAVIGQKRALDIEVQDLASGRMPAELRGRLWSASMIGDDEEYWPFEGEYWADEYEGWR